MTHLQEDKLKIIAEDDILLQAMREVFMGVVKMPELEGNENNSLIGEKYRGYKVAINGFDNMVDNIKSLNSNTKTSKDFDKSK